MGELLFEWEQGLHKVKLQKAECVKVLMLIDVLVHCRQAVPVLKCSAVFYPAW